VPIHSCNVLMGTPAAAMRVPKLCLSPWRLCDLSSAAALSTLRYRDPETTKPAL